MKIGLVKKLRKYLFFTAGNVAEILGLKRASANVFCSRYYRKGIFIRVKKDFYVLEERWAVYTLNEFLRIANFSQVPSYVSLNTALGYYGITTQVQRDYIESVSLKRSLNYEAGEVRFNFYKIDRKYYDGFAKTDNIFIASAEKALVDMVYLRFLGKYSADFTAIDFGRFDKARLRALVKRYPEKARKYMERQCRI